MSRSNYYGFSLLAHYLIDLFVHMYFSYRLRLMNTSFADNKYIVDYLLIQRVYPSQDLSAMNSNTKVKEKKDMRLVNNHVKGSQLKVGDIVQLQQGEIAPCDIILLNTSDLVHNKYVCTIECWFANGLVKSEQKKATEITRQFGKLFTKQDHSIIHALNRLSGTIEYWPFTINDEFKGTFKLRSDPKIEDLTSVNLVRKGSIIHSASVTGLAVFCGSTSLYYQHSFSNLRTKTSTISRKIHWYAISTIVINLTFSVISTMILMIKSSGVDLIENIDPHINDGTKFISFLVLFSPIQPLFVVALCNVVNFIQAIALERKYCEYKPTDNAHYKNCVKQFNYNDERRGDEVDSISRFLNDKNLLVANAYNLPNLGSIGDVFMDKTGTLSTSNFYVQSFATSKKIYRSSSNNFRVGGMVNVKSDKLNGLESNDSERSFEGYDTQIFKESHKRKKSEEEELNIYDFGNRKVLANPFADGIKGVSSMQSFGDLTGFDNQDDTKKSSNNLVIHQNEKFFQSGTAHRRGDSYGQKNDDIDSKAFDEVEFMTDTKTDRELKYVLQMFTLCHNAKVRSEE